MHPVPAVSLTNVALHLQLKDPLVSTHTAPAVVQSTPLVVQVSVMAKKNVFNVVT